MNDAGRKLLLDVNTLEFFHPSSGAPGSNGDFHLGPLTFDLYAREFMAVIGPNGSGKSTLLKLMAGLDEPARGGVTFDGKEVSRLEPRLRSRRIAMVRQNTALVFPLTVEQFVMLGRYPYGDRFGFDTESDHHAARCAMEAAQVCSLAQRRMDEISGGELQRVVLARALAQEPELLLLDEPTAHLDLSYQIELLRMIRRLAADQNMGVIAVMHEVNLAAQFSDYILLLRRGKLFRFGTPEEVLTAKALEEVYGVPVRVDWDPDSGSPHVTVIATADL